MFFTANKSFESAQPESGAGSREWIVLPVDVWESESFTEFTFSLSGGNLAVESAIIHNYTDPGGWTIDEPFTLAQ